MPITHLNPTTLHASPAFTQVVVVRDPQTLIYVGGQNAIAADGTIVGDDLRAQTAITGP